MARTIPTDLADRRRARLADLILAIGGLRGRRLTQREFSQSIGRDQGTIAAILGGHRALGPDVLYAVINAWGLPPDVFDVEAPPDFRALLPSEGTARRPRGGPLHEAPKPALASVPSDLCTRDGSPYGAMTVPDALDEVFAALAPDRAVAMSLAWLAHRGVRHDADGWAMQSLAAQAASDRGALGEWLDEALAVLALHDEDVGDTAQRSVTGPRAVVVHPAPVPIARISRGYGTAVRQRSPTSASQPHDGGAPGVATPKGRKEHQGAGLCTAVAHGFAKREGNGCGGGVAVPVDRGDDLLGRNL